MIEETQQTCPECGGAMIVARMGRLVEHRCHIGHRFGLLTMIDQKANNIDRALQLALAQSEELSSLLRIALAEAPEGDRGRLNAELVRRENEQRLLREISGGQTDLHFVRGGRDPGQ